MTMLILSIFASSCSENEEIRIEKDIELGLIQDNCIYNSNNHCAFTSIIVDKEQILVAFREGKAHRPASKEEYGSISILKKERNDWVKLYELNSENMDLRDPFFIHIFSR